MIKQGFVRIPNRIFDEHMKTLSGNEFLLYMAIIRKTWGWNKNSDKISHSQLMGMTGLSNKTVVKCLETLQQKELIALTKRFKRTNLITVLEKSTQESYVKTTHTTLHYNKQKDMSVVIGEIVYDE
tara:strand:+ start:1113 stop:1490 length:378 start_codon:yes stop_codon:yes gene_type:complete